MGKFHSHFRLSLRGPPLRTMVEAAEAIAEVGVQWGELPPHRTLPRPPTTTAASQSTPTVVRRMATHVVIKTGAEARPGKLVYRNQLRLCMVRKSWYPFQLHPCKRIHLPELSAQLLHKLSKTTSVSGTVMIWMQISISC